jgi:hypothetical protein
MRRCGDRPASPRDGDVGFIFLLTTNPLRVGDVLHAMDDFDLAALSPFRVRCRQTLVTINHQPSGGSRQRFLQAMPFTFHGEQCGDIQGADTFLVCDHDVAAGQAASQPPAGCLPLPLEPIFLPLHVFPTRSRFYNICGPSFWPSDVHTVDHSPANCSLLPLLPQQPGGRGVCPDPTFPGPG